MFRVPPETEQIFIELNDGRYLDKKENDAPVIKKFKQDHNLTGKDLVLSSMFMGMDLLSLCEHMPDLAIYSYSYDTLVNTKAVLSGYAMQRILKQYPQWQNHFNPN